MQCDATHERDFREQGEVKRGGCKTLISTFASWGRSARPQYVSLEVPFYLEIKNRYKYGCLGHVVHLSCALARLKQAHLRSALNSGYCEGAPDAKARLTFLKKPAAAAQGLERK